MVTTITAVLNEPINANVSALTKRELAYVITHSEFINQCLMQYPWMLALIDATPLCVMLSATKSCPCVELVMQHHFADIQQPLSESQQAAVIRQARHLGMMAIAWRDLLNQQSIEDSLIQVSRLANQLIMQAYAYAYQQFATRYGIPTDEHGQQHLYILGMGKLGGKELNFSSDIDLIFAYPSNGEFTDRRKPFEYQQFFIKVAQKLIHLLNTHTVDGQAYRVDMRLRPFGDSGPLVLPFAAIENYYESQGRSWERFAMLKSRIINPTPASQDPNKLALANIIRPFIYRRYVDFSIIDALRDLKQKIVQEVRRRQLHHNIKLGAGGIREVEFLVQSFQLIYAGRMPALKTASIFTALQVIENEALLPKDTVQQLLHCYLILRKTEHTLQQHNNAQTQTLPDDPVQRANLATVLAQHQEQYQAQHQATQVPLTADSVIEYVESVQAVIHQHFLDFIQEESNAPVAHDQQQLWHDIWSELYDQEPTALATTLPVAEPDSFLHELSLLTRDLHQAHMGDRGEALLARLMPVFLHEISQLKHRHTETLTSIRTIITAIASRTAYLELIYENAPVRQQLILFCAKSQWLIEHICAYPVLLDELIHPMYLQHTEHNIGQWQAEFSDELQQILLRIEPDDDEANMHALRQFKLAQRFRIAAADILGYLPIAQVSDKLTLLAEVLLDAQIKQAWQQVARRYGEPTGYSINHMGLGVIAYGKLGGLELSYTSDLDIVFVHQCPADTYTVHPQSDVASISAQQFYVKVVQRVVTLANSNSLLGNLYEIDLRLRPSGNSGLVICHIDTFAQYQQQEAWVWEHQALTRTRMIIGDSDIATRFQQIRHAILARPRDAALLAKDITAMRKKMRDHLAAKDKGSVADIEFLTQYWCLLYSHDYPAIHDYSDNLRQLTALGEHGVIDATTADTLIAAYLALRHQSHHAALQRKKAQQEDQDDINMTVNDIWQRTFNQLS